MKFKLKLLPINIIPGILVIAFYYTFTFISLAFYPTPFNPLNNWLSDLGNSNYNPNGAFFYNLGCILTGIALFPFYLSMYKLYGEEIWHKILSIIIQIIGCCSGFALIMIGMYPIELGVPHMIWSGAFFWFNLIVLILANITLIFHKDFMKPIAVYGFGVAIFNFLLVIITIFFIITPLLEWFTVFAALGYVGLIIFNRYRKHL
ncbi:MAG: hypothetical protein ACFFAH_03955 [Promethearchaeota archaeon]